VIPAARLVDEVTPLLVGDAMRCGRIGQRFIAGLRLGADTRVMQGFHCEVGILVSDPNQIPGTAMGQHIVAVEQA